MSQFPVSTQTGASIATRVYPHDVEVGHARKDSLGDDAYRALKASILEGTLPAGYQAVEQRIADQLNMSRTPVHEAIIRLQHEGLVRVLSRRGVQVLPMSTSDMIEVYQLLTTMEGLAAMLLAQRAGKPGLAVQVQMMTDATAHMERALAAGDLRGWAGADDQFHRILVAGCGNERLARMTATMVDQAQRARTLTLPVRPAPHESANEHRLMISAILAGDPIGARAAAENHRTRASADILRALDKL